MRSLAQDEFAYRFSQGELEGWITKEVRVEEGTIALLLIDGRCDRTLSPGTYSLGSFWKSLFSLGKPRREVVLLRSGEVSLSFVFSDLLTKDPMSLKEECTLALQYQRGEEAQFLGNLLVGRERLVLVDLRALLFSAAHDAAATWFSKFTLEELQKDHDLSELCLALEEAGTKSLAGKGIRLVRTSARRPQVAAADERDRKLAESLQQKWQGEASKSVEEVKVAKQESDLTMFERRAQMWERLGKAFNGAEISRIRSERELEDFMRSADRDKLLKEDDFERFKRLLREKREDDDKVRAHLVKMAGMEREFEYKQVEMRKRMDLTGNQIDFESGLDRLRQQGRFNIGRDRLDFETEEARKRAEKDEAGRQVHDSVRRAGRVEDARADSDVERLRRDSRRGDEELKLDIRKKETDLDRERRHDDLELRLKEREADLENSLKRLRQGHEQEMQRITTLSAAPIEALISISDPSKAPLLADLAALKIKEGMTPEKIVALAADRNPQVLAYLERANSAKPTSEEEKKLYERIIEEQKGFLSKQQEFYHQAFERYERMNTKALDAQAEIARAIGGARQTSPAQQSESVSSPAQRPPVEASPRPGRMPLVYCPKCHVGFQPGVSTCPNCGELLTSA